MAVLIVEKFHVRWYQTVKRAVDKLAGHNKQIETVVSDVSFVTNLQKFSLFLAVTYVICECARIQFAQEEI